MALWHGRSRQKSHWLARSSLVAVILLLTLAGSATAASGSSPHRGGTIIATWETELTTIDPAYTYGAQDWPQCHAVFDGLLGFDPHENLVPHLAASLPTVSNGGKTFTFHLRPGIVFSNGDPITAQDFIYSWERVLAPKTASPDTYFWPAVQGAAAFEAGKASHVSGFKALNSSTLQVTLSQPYSGFEYVLGTPTSFVVDPAVIQKYHAQNSDIKKYGPAAAIGAGPFILKDWIQGQRMDLVRNPHFWYKPWPYADAVRLDLGVNATVGVLRIERGQSDLLGDAIPAAQYTSLIHDPKWSKLIARGTDVGVYMIAMNVKVKPFTDIRVRRAVAYAINKLRAVAYINGRGIPATGILPPNLPGFHGGIPEQYPYNPSTAKQLLAQAGYPHGFNTTMGVPAGGYEVQMAEAAIYDLKQVGINVTEKPVLSEGAAIPTMPMLAYHWLMDYPDPADFIDGFTACASATANGSNVTFYCNPKLDDLAATARGMPFGPARVAAYNHIDELYMQAAASVPVFNDLLAYMHSARLQGYYISPSWFPFTLEQYWLSS